MTLVLCPQDLGDCGLLSLWRQETAPGNLAASSFLSHQGHLSPPQFYIPRWGRDVLWVPGESIFGMLLQPLSGF